MKEFILAFFHRIHDTQMHRIFENRYVLLGSSFHGTLFLIKVSRFSLIQVQFIANQGFFLLPTMPSLILPRLFYSRVFIFNLSKKLIPIHWSSIVALFGLLEFRARRHEQLNLLETIFRWVLWNIDFTCRII